MLNISKLAVIYERRYLHGVDHISWSLVDPSPGWSFKFYLQGKKNVRYVSNIVVDASRQ